MPVCLARFAPGVPGEATGVVRALAGAFLLAPGPEPGVVRSTTPTPIDRNAVPGDPPPEASPPKPASSRILRRAVLGGMPDASSDADELPVSVSAGVATAPSAGVAAGVAGGVVNAAGCLPFDESRSGGAPAGAASAAFLGVTNPKMDRWSGARALGTPRGAAIAPPAARASPGALVKDERFNPI